MSDIDLQLFVTARDVVQVNSVTDKSEGLNRFIEILKTCFRRPSSFTRRWSRRNGRAVYRFWHPLRFFADFFRQEKSRLWPLFGMLRLLKPYWRIPATLFTFDLVSSFLLVPVPFLIASIWHAGTTPDILMGCGVIAGLVGLGLVVSAIKEAYESAAISSMWLQWQLKFVQRVLHRKARHSAGEALTRFEDAEAAFDGTIEIVTSFASGIAHLLPLPIFLFLLPSTFIAQIAVLIVAVGMLYAVFSALVYHYSSGIARLRGQTNEGMVEVLGKADSIRAMRISRDAIRRVREKAEPFRDEQVKLQVVSSIVHIGLGFGHPWPHCSHRAGNRCRQKRRVDPSLRRRRMAGAIISPVLDLFDIGYIQRVLVSQTVSRVYREETGG